MQHHDRQRVALFRLGLFSAAVVKLHSEVEWSAWMQAPGETRSVDARWRWALPATPESARVTPPILIKPPQYSLYHS